MLKLRDAPIVDSRPVLRSAAESKMIDLSESQYPANGQVVDLAGCGDVRVSVLNQMITESLCGRSIAAQLVRSLDLVNKTLSNLRNGSLQTLVLKGAPRMGVKQAI
jgi:hypothetical protein